MATELATINEMMIRPPEDSPVRPYQTVINKSGGKLNNRIFIGTPATGLVRIEWVNGRYGQIIPMNWSHVEMRHYLNSYVPLGYQVADAQNLIVAAAVQGDYEWLFLLEHDVIIPPDCFIRINRYIRAEDTPVVSGLYFSRSRPSDPLVFRGRGTSIYSDFKLPSSAGGDDGDLVWCDGVPTGVLLIHMGLIREMWKDSEEYELLGQKTRRVFDSPRDQWQDPEDNNIWYSEGGTSDLAWCTRVMEGGYFAKAGWHEYADKEFPFLIDTNIFCRHINPDGEQFP